MHGCSPPIRLTAAASVLLLIGCDSGGSAGTGPTTIDEVRVATHVNAEVDPLATSLDRFGDPFATEPEPEAPENPLVWEVPPGWTEVPPRSQFRLADFQVGDDPRAECYATILPGSAGGVLENVNRWATQQLGLAPVTPDEIAALPRHPVLGAPAYLYEADGDYAGMGGDPLVDARLMGLILEDPQFTLFVKLTGPRDVVLAQREAFLDFGASLRTRSQASSAPAAGNSAAPPAPGAGSAAGAAPPAAYVYDLPTGWALEAPRPFRLLSFSAGEAGSVSVSHAGGTLEENLDRWYGQMGQTAPNGVGILGLERVTVLGLASLVVDITGDFTGMGGGTVPDQRLLGVICPRPGESLFIKLVGPQEAVEAERERVLTFAQSLRPSGEE